MNDLDPVYILATTHDEAQQIAQNAGRKWVHLTYPGQLPAAQKPEVWRTTCWPPPRWAGGQPGLDSLADILRARGVGWTPVDCIYHEELAAAPNPADTEARHG